MEKTTIIDENSFLIKDCIFFGFNFFLIGCIKKNLRYSTYLLYMRKITNMTFSIPDEIYKKMKSQRTPKRSRK